MDIFLQIGKIEKIFKIKDIQSEQFIESEIFARRSQIREIFAQGIKNIFSLKILNYKNICNIVHY